MRPESLFIRRYSDYAKEFTDAPGIYHRFVASWVIACAIEDRAWMDLGQRRLKPNLYVLLLAPSSSYRKSTAIDIGTNLLEELDNEMIYPQGYSYESLLRTFSRRPTGTLIYDEFATLTGNFKREYSAQAEPLLTTLYGGSPFMTVTGKGDNEERIIVKDPCINLMTASTFDWLKGSVKAASVQGGFLPRFVLVPALSRDSLMAFQPPADLDKRGVLMKILHQFRAIKRQPGQYTQEAKAFYEKWYREFVTRVDSVQSDIEPFLARLTVNAHKLAIINAVDFGEYPRISQNAVFNATQACEMVANSLESVVSGLNDIPDRKNVYRNKVESILKSLKHNTITQRDLMRKSRLSKADLSAVLATIRDCENLREIKPGQNGSDNSPRYGWQAS